MCFYYPQTAISLNYTLTASSANVFLGKLRIDAMAVPCFARADEWRRCPLSLTESKHSFTTLGYYRRHPPTSTTLVTAVSISKISIPIKLFYILIRAGSLMPCLNRLPEWTTPSKNVASACLWGWGANRKVNYIWGLATNVCTLTGAIWWKVRAVCSNPLIPDTQFNCCVLGFEILPPPPMMLVNIVLH